MVTNQGEDVIIISVMRDKVVKPISWNWNLSKFAHSKQITADKSEGTFCGFVDGSHNFSFFSRNFQGGNRKLLA